MVRLCRKCNIEKPVTEFHKNKSRKDGLQSWCKACQQESTYAWRAENLERANAISRRSYENRGREAQRGKLYGMQPGEYDTMLALQDGRCAICGRAPYDRPLDVDHDHVTKRVRGLLCRQCNSGIGKLQDSVELLMKAVKYLEP